MLKNVKSVALFITSHEQIQNETESVIFMPWVYFVFPKDPFYGIICFCCDFKMTS